MTCTDLDYTVDTRSEEGGRRTGDTDRFLNHQYPVLQISLNRLDLRRYQERSS